MWETFYNNVRKLNFVKNLDKINLYHEEEAYLLNKSENLLENCLNLNINIFEQK